MHLGVVSVIIFFGLNDMIQKQSYSHLTLWTWMYHGLAYGSKHLKNRVIKEVCVLTSCIGSFCILNAYMFTLLLNPTLEYDLFRKTNNYDESTFATHVHVKIWLRSIILHVLPVLYSYRVIQKWKDKFKGLSSQYNYLYLSVPLVHIVTGIMYKYVTGKDDFNAFFISSNNRFGITEPLFIATTGGVMLSTIFATQYYIKNLN